MPIIILSVLADFSMVWEAFNQVLSDENIFFICAALVALYLSFGHFAGKKLAEWAAFRRGASFWASMLMCLVMLAILVLIFAIRLIDQSLEEATNSTHQAMTSGFGAQSGFGGFGEGFGVPPASTGDSADDLASVFKNASSQALLNAMGLSAVMFLGAAASFVHAYFTLDPFASEKARLASACIAEDKLLYESAFAARAIDPERDARISAAERELDVRTVDCAFRIHGIALQLNSIVDPADAHDFERIRSLLNRTATQGNGRFAYEEE